jgi:hypothetical protein
MTKTKEKIPGTKQIYCHECIRWMRYEDVKILSISTSQEVPVVKFKCPLCNKEGYGVAYYRMTRAVKRRRKK